MTIVVSHGRVPTATALSISVRVRSDSGYLNGFTVDFGDGQKHQENPVAVACPVSSQQTAAAPASTATRTVNLSYRVPGHYRLRVNADVNRGECDTPRYPAETLTATTLIDVTPGAAVANGPLRPSRLLITNDPVTAPSTDGRVALDVLTDGDLDGVITRYVWSWGDGTTSTVQPLPAGDCKDTGRTWPTVIHDPRQAAAAAAGESGSSARHHYRHTGKYTVQVTAISSGCHGENPQQTITAIELPVQVK